MEILKSRIIKGFFLFLFIVAIFRTFHLTVIDRFNSSHKPLFRGHIYSHDNAILAFNINNFRLLLKKEIEETGIKNVSDITGISIDEIKSRLNAGEGSLILIQDKMDKKYILPLQKIDDKNIVVDNVPTRYHTYPSLLTHVLGFIDRDDNGIMGVEKQYNSFLLSENKTEQHNLILSVDLELQKVVEEMLNKKIAETKAPGGFVIIQEIATGLIRSMAYRPAFNFNNIAKAEPTSFINNTVSGVFEPGSVMKVFFISYLLDNKIIDTNQTFKTDGFIKLINGEVINDTAPAGEYNLASIIQKSSNAGMIYAMDKVSSEDMYLFLKKAHFFEKTNIDLPAETSNLIPPISEWGIRTTATVPIGHGIALSPISVITVFNSLLNGGVYVEPRIVEKTDISVDGEHFIKDTGIKIRPSTISQETSLEIIKLLANGTGEGSTGTQANRGNFISIGKTGTSTLIDQRVKTYTHKHYTFFIGAYPSEKPIFSMFIGIYEPESGGGGAVSAPLYGDIIETAVKRLLPQDDPKKEEMDNKHLDYQLDVTRYQTEEVPSFIGLSLRDALIAKQILQQYLYTKNISISINIIGERGVVKKQSLRGGTKIINGAVITLEMGE